MLKALLWEIIFVIELHKYIMGFKISINKTLKRNLVIFIGAIFSSGIVTAFFINRVPL